MEKRSIWLVLLVFILSVIGGAFAYSSVEGWSLLNSFYFVVVTVTTIGYGDLTPVTNVGKVFTMFFAFFGVATALYILSKISSSLFRKHVGQKVSEIKRDVKEQEEVKKEVKETIKEAVSKRK
jgi:large-conductance mechanosensitive channel|tara:strand:- start:1210 stop:1578 length:369 start_codon:yes stop_codon:yes gene_type:complete